MHRMYVTLRIWNISVHGEEEEDEGKEKRGNEETGQREKL